MDIVIGDKLVQYDFDTTADSKYKKGEIIGVGRFIESDKELVTLCKKTLENNQDRDFNIKVGTIATADYFCADPEVARSTREEFGAECVEMEGASIAQVCHLSHIPFLVLRSISDTPNNDNVITYEEFLEQSSKKIAIAMKNILEKLDN